MLHDVIVLGGGAAGASAALTAAQLGARVLMIDAEGGRGGAQVKGAAMLAMHRNLAVRHQAGGRARAQRLLAARAKERTRLEARAIDRYRELREAGVEVVRAAAAVQGAGVVAASDAREWSAGWVVLATGSQPRRAGRFGVASEIVCDPETLLASPDVPRSLLVVGAEEEGCELASVYASLGSQVTLVERRRKLFRLGDRDVLDPLHRGLQHAGVAVAVEEDLLDLDLQGSPQGAYALARLASGRTESCDRVVFASGRASHADAAIAESFALARDERGFVQVDDCGRTSCERVLAAGDVTGPPFRIGIAVHAARAAVIRALTGGEVPIGDVPTVVHTIPQVAVVGLGEDAAKLLGLSVVVGRAATRDLALFRTETEQIELLKLVFRLPELALIGVQIVGGGADELIHLGAAFLGGSPERIAALIVSHPSKAELFRLAAISAARQLGSLGAQAPADEAGADRWR